LTPDLALRLTTARWLTPRGQSLERRQGVGAAARGGLIPDILLDDAARFDAFTLPHDWSPVRSGAMSAFADSLAVGALLDSPSDSPHDSAGARRTELTSTLAAALQVAMLEARLRTRAALAPSPAPLRDLPRVERVNIATRLAVVRVLEQLREPTALLRYSARSDAGIRAGLDLLAPGVEVSHVIPSIMVSARAVSSRRQSADTDGNEVKAGAPRLTVTRAP
jgi:hypothetical protein